MDDTGHASRASHEPSKSSAFAKLEIKERSTDDTDEKGGASIESKVNEANEEKPEEVRRERRTSSYLARRRHLG